MSSRPSSFALTSPGSLRLYSTQELLLMPPPSWQIGGIVPAGGLVGLYGPPGVGKSFVAIDMAMSIACGGLWHAHEVAQGMVLYISAEGGTGIGKRVKAWLQTRGVEARDAKVAWLTEALPVYSDSSDMDRLFQRFNEEIADVPALVIVDTLARCFDGDENQQEDMGRFVAGVDRYRREFGSTVLVVHHTRLDGERERGNTAFRGAADTMMSLSRDKRTGLISLACNKQKDAEEFTTHTFRLETVSGTDSCAIAATETGASPASLVRGVNPILAALDTYGSLSFSELVMAVSGVSRATLHRYLVRLVKSGEIVKEMGEWRKSSLIVSNE